jgi:hypothetical protein
MFNRQGYFDRLVNFTDADAKKEIQDLSEEMGLDKDHYTIFLETSGYGYLIKKMAAEVYLSRTPICETLRQKILILGIISDNGAGSSNLLRINNILKRIKANCWEYSIVINDKEKIIRELDKIIDKFYRNCLTCADHPNGCKGEDKECCSPAYNDWREPASSK